MSDSERFGVEWKFSYDEYAAVGRVAIHLQELHGLDAGDALAEAETIVAAVLAEIGKPVDER